MSTPTGDTDYFEYDTSSNRVRCRICLAHVVASSQRSPDGWIERSSMAAHRRSVMHNNSLDLHARAQARLGSSTAGSRQRGQPMDPAPQDTSSRNVAAPHFVHESFRDTSNRQGPLQMQDYDAQGVAFDSDDHRPSAFDFDDDLDVTPEEEEEIEKRIQADAEAHFLRASAEMTLGGSLDGLEDETSAAAHDFLDELAAMEEQYDEAAEPDSVFLDAMLKSNWRPYPNETMLLLDFFDNIPRGRISSAMFRVLLYMLKRLGVRNVPSLYALRKLQRTLREKFGVKTERHKSSLGNVFYSNNINALVAQDYANPLTSAYIVNYPEDCLGAKSEVWQFSRWKELPRELLTPMYARGSQHFYVDELAQTKSGALVIPLMWILRNVGNGVVPQLCADALPVQIINGRAHVESGLTTSIVAEDLALTYLELWKHYNIPFDDASQDYVSRMPNKLREVAAGLPLYSSFLNVWADDVSGNVSKQYNKHENVCFTHSNLPGTLLQQEYHVHFVSTSQHASSLEQFEAVQSMIKKSQTDPVETYFASKRQYCKVRNIMICGPGDNPQQSKECSHIGLGGNMLCRDCDCGGDSIFLESHVGYESLFEPQIPRRAKETLQEIQAQLDAAMTGVQKTVTEMQKISGIKDALSQHWIEKLIQQARQLRKGDARLSKEQAVEKLKVWLASETSQPFNPLFAMPGLDPHRDTPVEILHTVLLGIVKYVWHMFNTSWKGTTAEDFATWFQATNTDGLSIPAIRASYAVQYKNNLIGKHFKTLMQTLAFHGGRLASEKVQHLINCVGELGALLWVPEIDDLDTYLHDLEILIDNVLDAFSAADPTRIILKPKIHVLKHIIQNIRRFGPAIRFSTEIFESFNAVFRQCSILSNRQAPSRDIAEKFATMEHLKHIMASGYWIEGNQLCQAGSSLRQLVETNPMFLQYLGWTAHDSQPIGTCQLQKKSANSVSWPNTKASRFLDNERSLQFSGLSWMLAKSVIIKSGEDARNGMWVCIQTNEGLVLFGRILEIIKTEQAISHPVLLTLEQFALGDQRHPTLKMPVLHRNQPYPGFVTIPSQILFVFNVQHDCFLAKCSIQVKQSFVTQERERIACNSSSIQHTDDEQFIINTHGLHNAHLLRRYLPRRLVQPAHTHSDRKAFHADLAPQAEATQAQKREDAVQKRAVTLAARNAAADPGVEIPAQGGPSA